MAVQITQAARKRPSPRPASSREGTLDPTTFAVIFNALNSIVQEMSLTFEHSAWSSILSEARDFSCAIYTSSVPPNALCVLDGLPIHVNAQPITIAEVAKFFGEEEIFDGDVMMVNSVYYGTTHCGDLVVACPIFYQGEHVFWAAATGHQMDIGSPNPTSVAIQATDVWSEGFQISPVKLEEKGKIRKDMLQLYLENVRYREFLHGDLMSQVGSVKTGKKRMLELLDKWGVETLKKFSQEMIIYADRRTREEISKWPDGTYHSESWVDSDGTGMTNIAIKCKVTISGSEVDIDFTGSDPQVRGSTNSSWATCQNAASIPILSCLDPDLPHNEGSLKHITVFAPKGTITNVEWPGCASDATMVPSDSIIDAVWKCLAQAIPDKAVAGYGHIAPNAFTSGYDRRVAEEKKPFSLILFNGSAGGGASKEADGMPLQYSPGCLGGLKFISVELMELHHPLLALRQEIRTDSMGAGATRGGPGITWQVTPRGTGQVDNYAYGDGMFNPPFGLLGGRPGDGGALYRINKDGTRTFFSMIAYFRVHEGESWTALSTGGGGYGDPLERNPELVRIDVRDEIISVRAARADYGVVIDPATLEVHYAATEELRKELAKSRESNLIVPSTADFATFYKELMRSGDTFELNPRPSTDSNWTL
jgi:N-methylhydantoinase B